MRKSQKSSSPPAPDWSNVGARVRWLMDTKFAGNRSAMARAIAFSHTIIANIVKGKTPGRFVLDAMVDRLGVDSDWLRDGVGQPYPSDDVAGVPTGIAVSEAPLPGPPPRCPELVTGGWVDVPGISSSKSTYWLILKSSSPLVQRPSSGFHAGDHLLIETDPAYFPREDTLFDSLCVLRKGAEVRLAYVTYRPASIDTGDAHLEADYPRPPAKAPVVVERVYRHHGSGEVQFFERSSNAAKHANPELVATKVQFRDILGVWKKIIHRTFG